MPASSEPLMLKNLKVFFNEKIIPLCSFMVVTGTHIPVV